jgi:hypothetical protein
MKGVCLLLLGLTAAAGSRIFAADIETASFARLVESSTSATVGTAEATPFKEESGDTTVKAIAVDPTVPATGMTTMVASDPNDNFAGAPGRVWFHGDYVHWWTSGAHLPPMISTLTGATATVPATVFGDETVYGGNHDGYRVAMGAWIDREHLWGVEMDYLDVAGRQNNYDSGFTDGYSNGTPYPLVRLVYDPATYATSGLAADYIGLGGFVNGRETVETSDYFQTAGVTLRRQLRASEWSTSNSEVNWMDSSARTFRLDAIGGYRFARLIDTVNEQDDTFVFATGAAVPNSLYDYQYVNNYRTVNDFNGGELGLNVVYTFGRWSLDVVGKAALGVNNEYVSLYNQQTTDVSNARGVATPPILSNASPLQEFSRNRFSAIPELTVTAGYQVTDHLKLTVGYDLLYWTAVVRAADQIAVEPTTGYPYGTVLGNYSTLPAFSWNESHYFAEGLRLGGELRF